MALVVKRPPLHEVNKAFVLVVMQFRIESHLVNDCLTAGVIKILCSLFPFPTTDSTSELTWSIFNDASSDTIIRYDLVLRYFQNCRIETT